MEYEKLRIAKINKIPTPVIIIEREGRKIKGLLSRKSTVDFIGTIKIGQFVGIECKQTEQDRFTLSNIKPHQYDYLKTIHELNGISFVLIEFANINKYVRLDFKTLEQYFKRKEEMENQKGSCSFTFDDVKHLEIKPSPICILDFLNGYY